MSRAQEATTSLSVKPTIIMLAVVVASFVSALWLSHARTAEIDRSARDIVSVTPSIDALASTRVQLRRIGLAVAELIAASAVRDADGISSIDDARNALTVAVLSFEVLPSFEGKAEALGRLKRELRDVDDLIAKMTADLAGLDFIAAEATMRSEFHAAIERADVAIADAQSVAGHFARMRASEITDRRQSASNLAVVLGGVCVGGSVVAAALAVRTIRRQRRMVVERSALLAGRASELEAFGRRIAHDLRGPLNTMGLRIEMLRDVDRSQQPIEPVVARLDGDLTRMNRLIEGLLDFAVVGASPANGANADLRGVVEDVVSEVRVQAQRTGVDVVIDEVPFARVACTNGALTSVLSNLLQNAAKYVVNGTAPPRVLVRGSTRGSRVHIEVEDNGPGIPPGSEGAVFEPFHRLRGNTQPGLGLGLATVKKIVESCGGRVGVTSSPGSCTFWFELPRVGADVADGAISSC